jgi:hypothetical protein
VCQRFDEAWRARFDRTRAAASSEPAASVVRLGRHRLRLRRDSSAVHVVLCDVGGTVLFGGYSVFSLWDDYDKLFWWRHGGVDSYHCLTDDMV